MPTQLLVNVLRVPAVGNLAPGASVTLAHGLKSAGVGVTPTLIEPGGATNIVVSAADATNVTFTNNDANAGFATFRVSFDHSIIAEAPVAPLWWQGITGSPSPSGAASGDLTGTYPAPTVAKLQGQPIVSGTPLAGSDLEFSAGSWTPTFRFNGSITNLYVNNATGSDSNDGLTALTAKKTIQAAVNAAGMFLAATTGSGPNVTINIAAQSTTENVEINGIYSGNGTNSASIGIGFQGAAQTVLAGPFTLTAVSNADPDCPAGFSVGGACTITAGAATWTPSAFKGKFVRLTSGATSSYAPIIDNSATVLTIVRNSAGATGFSVGNTVEIVEPSTIVNGTFTVKGTNITTAIFDVALAPTTNIQPFQVSTSYRPAALTLYALQLQRCLINAPATNINTSLSSVQMVNCVWLGNSGNQPSVSAQGTSVSLFRCYLNNFSNLIFRDGLYFSAFGLVLDGFSSGTNELCAANNLTHVKFKGMGGSVNLTGINGARVNGTFNGVLFYSAANTITHMLVTGSLAYNLTNVVFTNGAVGLSVTSGAQVSSNGFGFAGCTTGMTVDAGSTVTAGSTTFSTGITNGIILDGGSTFVCTGNIFFNGTTKPCTMKERSLLTTRGTVTGTAGGGSPTFRINDGSRFVYTVLPAVTGGSTDFSFDGTTKAYADLPYFNTLLSGAAIKG